ncbi:MAG: triose-phosphate isomerase [marine benthic group bacterium]|nr:triose-phosphate isomerase [Candidatus Benthicola marisminoris]
MSEIDKPFFAANWKMHLGPAETSEFVRRFRELHPPRERGRVVFFPPTLSVAAFRTAAEGRPDLEVGVQDVHQDAAGAHTGSVSAVMAAQAGAVWALAGHSERRREFGDGDGLVTAKVSRLLEAGVRPILCVGETLEERENGRLDEVLARQIGAVLDAVDAAELVYAYEPVWAIGTGRTASPDDAANAHGIVRREIEAHGGFAAAPILYGGSVKPANIEELLAAPGVDGVLVGGASLEPDSFAAICAAG